VPAREELASVHP